MENQTKESLSDSDSSNSSWVLLDEKHSDVESDTDGISVISEPDDNLSDLDSVQEIPSICDEKEAETEEHIKKDDSIENVSEPNTELLPSHTPSFLLKKMCNITSLIGAGVVVALLMAPLMPSKSNEITRRNLEPYQDTMSTAKPIDPLVTSLQNFKTKEAKIYIANKHSQKHKKYSNSHLSDNHKQTAQSESKRYIKPEKPNQMRHKDTFESKTKKTQDVRKYDNKYKEEKQKREQYKHEYEQISKKFKKIAKKLNAKDEYLSKKERYLIKKEYDILMKELELQEKLYDYYNLDTNKKNFNKHRTSSSNFEKGNNKNETKDGHWHARLHNGRDEIRKREHNAGWWFDRAAMRIRLRDKAQWYFQWMVGREETRCKKNY